MIEIGRRERIAIAKQVGVNEQYLYQCLSGRRDMSPSEAVRIETETAGRLSRLALCQRSGPAIWPELANVAMHSRQTVDADIKAFVDTASDSTTFDDIPETIKAKVLGHRSKGLRHD